MFDIETLLACHKHRPVQPQVEEKHLKSHMHKQDVETALNTMQLETADFAPGAATWRTGRNTCASLLFWPICSILWKHNIIHKTEVHNILHCPNRRIEPARHR